jgi:hypothetical protein
MKLAEHFPLSSYLAGHHTAWRRNYTNSELACHAIGQSLVHPPVNKILIYSSPYVTTDLHIFLPVVILPRDFVAWVKVCLVYFCAFDSYQTLDAKNHAFISIFEAEWHFWCIFESSSLAGHIYSSFFFL